MRKQHAWVHSLQTSISVHRAPVWPTSSRTNAKFDDRTNGQVNPSIECLHDQRAVTPLSSSTSTTTVWTFLHYVNQIRALHHQFLNDLEPPCEQSVGVHHWQLYCLLHAIVQLRHISVAWQEGGQKTDKNLLEIVIVAVLIRFTKHFYRCPKTSSTA